MTEHPRLMVSPSLPNDTPNVSTMWVLKVMPYSDTGPSIDNTWDSRVSLQSHSSKFCKFRQVGRLQIEWENDTLDWKKWRQRMITFNTHIHRKTQKRNMNSMQDQNFAVRQRRWIRCITCVKMNNSTETNQKSDIETTLQCSQKEQFWQLDIMH